MKNGRSLSFEITKQPKWFITGLKCGGKPQKAAVNLLFKLRREHCQ